MTNFKQVVYIYIYFRTKLYFSLSEHLWLVVNILFNFNSCIKIKIVYHFYVLNSLKLIKLILTLDTINSCFKDIVYFNIIALKNAHFDNFYKKKLYILNVGIIKQYIVFKTVNILKNYLKN